MKTLIIFILLITAISCSAQRKGDNTIRIDTFRTIKEVKQVLFNNGFTVDGADTSFFVTLPKQMNSAAVFRLMFARNDTSIILKCQAKFQIKILGADDEFSIVEYRNSKQNLKSGWFLEMDKIAKLLGSKITYLKQ